MPTLTTRYAQPAPPPSGLNHTSTPPGINGHPSQFAPQYSLGSPMNPTPLHATGGFTPPPMATNMSRNGPHIPTNPANHVQATRGGQYSSPSQQQTSLQHVSQSSYLYSQPTIPIYKANANPHIGIQSSNLPIQPPGMINSVLFLETFCCRNL